MRESNTGCGLAMALLMGCSPSIAPTTRDVPKLQARPSKFEIGETIPFNLRIDLHRADGVDGDLAAELLVSVVDASSDGVLLEDRVTRAIAHPTRGDTLGLSLAPELVGATVRARFVDGERQSRHGGKSLRALMDSGFHQILPVIDLSREAPGQRQEMTGKPFDMYRDHGAGLYRETAERTACPDGVLDPCTAWHRDLLPEPDAIRREEASSGDALLDRRGVPVWIRYHEHFFDGGEPADTDTYLGIVDVEITVERAR